MILPYLDQSNLYNACNFNIVDELTRGTPNYTANQTKVGVLLCPSEAAAMQTYGTNYAGNRGVGERILPDSGVFCSLTPIKLAGITDGLSTTAAVSEWVIGPGDLTTPDHTTKDHLGSVFATPHHRPGAAALPQFLADCRSLRDHDAEIHQNDKGKAWLHGGYRHTFYNHTLSINERSCVSSGHVREGAYSAASRHPGGAHTLFADGHVQFQSSTIALPLWRAQGTRSAGDSTE